MTGVPRPHRRFLNLVCFCVHFAMVWVTIYFHHWSSKGEKDLRLPVYRISINYTFLDDITGDGPPDPQNFRYSLVENNMPIDLGVLCCIFFGISAGFHFLALMFGIFPTLWYYYWRQMDDGFCWWRWLEYTFSASFMAMAVAVVIGMREENIVRCCALPVCASCLLPLWCPLQLASIFLLHVCTMVCGFFTELWSRPRSYADAVEYQWRAGPGGGYSGVPMYSRLKKEEVHQPDGTTITILRRGNPNALKRIAQDE